MRNRCSKILILVCFAVSVYSSCTDDSRLVPTIPDQSFVEEFDTIESAYSRGWRFFNRSVPIGPANWEQATTFPSFSSATSAFGHIEQSFLASAGTTPQRGGIISNWIISPVLIIKNNDKIIFYTRSSNPQYIDRMQLRMNVNNESTECGSGKDAGSFDKVLFDVNPFYLDDPSVGGYPDNWTRFEATVRGLRSATKGRFAFRAFIEGGGPGLSEFGSVIGVDSVAYISGK